MAELTKSLPTPDSFALETGEQGNSFIELFERQADKFGDKLSIRSKHGDFSFKQLKQSTHQVARAILAQYRGEPRAVALLAGKTPMTVAAMLGILKSGNFFVPLDPASPAQRNTFILEDSQAILILSDQTNLAAARELTRGQIPLIDLDALPQESMGEAATFPRITPDAIARLVYTSGSTGQPKGVISAHANLLGSARRMQESRRQTPEDRVAVLGSFAFAAGLSSVFHGVVSGASLHLYDLNAEGFAGLADWIDGEGITVFTAMTTVFRQLMETVPSGRVFSSVRSVSGGGEAVLKRDFELFKEHFGDHCIYRVGLGGTEMGMVSQNTFTRQTPMELPVLPAGFVAPPVEVFLWDDVGNEVSPGEVGEIVVKSPYLSPGYWHRPDLTAEKFPLDPKGSGARLYRSGDLGLFLPDGQLLHKGRKDTQVKIKGIRVEIAEVETALLNLDGVKQAAATTPLNRFGQPMLVAYVVMHTGKTMDLGRLRAALKIQLPEHLIPSRLVLLDKLPMGAGGKLDYKSLPAPDRARPSLQTPYREPQTLVEMLVTNIWAEVLDLEQIGVEDKFLELGGDSLGAARVVARVMKSTGVNVPQSALFDTPTVAQMAAVIEAAGGQAPDLETLLDEIEMLSDEEAAQLLAEAKQVQGK
ncbi:MAG: AMP-binding protein [Verrucomicrobiales bacterium]|nr:AMP-binding protein [Verrucomicrobiales bacterium]